MMRIRLGITDAGQIRLGFSALSETVLSLRALAVTPASGLHASWVGRVRPELGRLDLELLGALVPATGYIPDFLLPAVAPEIGGSHVGFDAGLALVAGVEPEVAASHLRRLRRPVGADPGPGAAARRALVGELCADPVTGLRRIATELRRYWTVAVEPYWASIGALLRADCVYRSEVLARRGIREGFRGLHPSMALCGDTLCVDRFGDGELYAGRRGLLLVPSVFAWPAVVMRDPGPRIEVTYAPRGLGRLRESVFGSRATDALADLVGRSRAAILAQLELPASTVQLAELLGLSAPTVSVHLGTLEAAGAVVGARDGKAVLYRRTGLGEDLLTAAPHTGVGAYRDSGLDEPSASSSGQP